MEPTSRVLALYTGGTIGMRRNARGVFEPVAGWFAEQLELAKHFDLPALVHTPHRDKRRGTERSLALGREAQACFFDVRGSIRWIT